MSSRDRTGILSSVSNPRVKHLRRVVHESRTRRSEQLFALESDREIERCLQAGFQPEAVYYTDRSDTVDRLIERGAEAFEVTDSIIKKVSYRENPQGIVSVFHARHMTFDDVILPPDPITVVCSGLEKPGNLGAIMRTADAVGASVMFIDSPSFDVYNPNCVRSSTGTVFTLPIIQDTPDRIADFLATRSITCVATLPDAPATYINADFTGPVAFVLGSEAQGLNDFWQRRANRSVSLPMRGTADSLNVSTTAAILMFEALRQRSAGNS